MRQVAYVLFALLAVSHSLAISSPRVLRRRTCGLNQPNLFFEADGLSFVKHTASCGNCSFSSRDPSALRLDCNEVTAQSSIEHSISDIAVYFNGNEPVAYKRASKLQPIGRSFSARFGEYEVITTTDSPLWFIASVNDSTFSTSNLQAFSGTDILADELHEALVSAVAGDSVHSCIHTPETPLALSLPQLEECAQRNRDVHELKNKAFQASKAVLVFKCTSACTPQYLLEHGQPPIDVGAVSQTHKNCVIARSANSFILGNLKIFEEVGDLIDKATNAGDVLAQCKYYPVTLNLLSIEQGFVLTSPSGDIYLENGKLFSTAYNELAIAGTKPGFECAGRIVGSLTCVHNSKVYSNQRLAPIQTFRYSHSITMTSSRPFALYKDNQVQAVFVDNHIFCVELSSKARTGCPFYQSPKGEVYREAVHIATISNNRKTIYLAYPYQALPFYESCLVIGTTHGELKNYAVATSGAVNENYSMRAAKSFGEPKSRISIETIADLEFVSIWDEANGYSAFARVKGNSRFQCLKFKNPRSLKNYSEGADLFRLDEANKTLGYVYKNEVFATRLVNNKKKRGRLISRIPEPFEVIAVGQYLVFISNSIARIVVYWHNSGYIENGFSLEQEVKSAIKEKLEFRQKLACEGFKLHTSWDYWYELGTRNNMKLSRFYGMSVWRAKEQLVIGLTNGRVIYPPKCRIVSNDEHRMTWLSKNFGSLNESNQNSSGIWKYLVKSDDSCLAYDEDDYEFEAIPLMASNPKPDSELLSPSPENVKRLIYVVHEAQTHMVRIMNHIKKAIYEAGSFHEIVNTISLGFIYRNDLDIEINKWIEELYAQNLILCAVRQEVRMDNVLSWISMMKDADDELRNRFKALKVLPAANIESFMEKTPASSEALKSLVESARNMTPREENVDRINEVVRIADKKQSKPAAAIPQVEDEDDEELAIWLTLDNNPRGARFSNQ